MLIAEGRDKQTKRSMIKMRKLIKKYLRRATQQKSGTGARAVIESLLAKIEENDSKVIARNKLQIDGAKWLAKSVNPNEFSEKSTLSLNGGSDNAGIAAPITIQFVGPDGSVVRPTFLPE
jgi:hypothetical protein